MIGLILYLILILFDPDRAQCQNPFVETDRGVLRGSWKTSLSGRSYASFQGIPYAKPPIGELRFRNPQPVEPWQGIWDATKYLSVCLQFDAFQQKITGTEDCLFLNVFSTNLRRNSSLPVIVFIHGGALFYGAGSLYDPVRLMDKDVVVVTLNYRLGVFGFIATGDNAASGNFGLKDQSLALHWIQRNIRCFGGNPHSVTLIGQSAGAASVHFHFLSPWSVGTFHRAVFYSGTAFSPWAYTINPAQKTSTLASLVGCPTRSSYEMIDCLRNRPAEVVIAGELPLFELKLKLFSPFAATAESPYSFYPFLTQHPYLSQRLGAVQKLPILITYTSEEGLYPGATLQASPDLIEEYKSNWVDWTSKMFVYKDKLPADKLVEVAEQIKQHYLHGATVGKDNFSDLVNALTDRLFLSSIAEFARLHSYHSGQPVYMGRYSFQGNFSLTNFLANNNEKYGVCHCDDFLHIFKGFNLYSNSTDDINMSKVLIDVLYSFATTEVPRVGGTTEWKPVIPGSKNLNYMEISSPYKFEMKTDDFHEQKRFWNNQGLLGN